MNRKTLYMAFAAASWGLLVLTGRASALVVASDDAADPAYSSGWYATGDGSGQPASNGGFGFAPWQVTAVNGPPSLLFMDSSSDHISGSQSFAIAAGANGFGLYRPLLNPLNYGTFNIVLRFNSSQTSGGTDFNVDGGNKFLLSVEMTPSLGDNGLELLDGGQHFLRFTQNPSASLVGDVLDCSTTFNTNTGAYLFTVVDETNNRTATFAGTLQFQGLPVNEFFMGTGQTGSQGPVMDFDSLTVTVPEPSGVVLALSAFFFGLGRSKRMRVNHFASARPAS